MRAQMLILAPMLGALLWAAWIDLRWGRIPNWLSVSLALGGLACSVASIVPGRTAISLVTPGWSLAGLAVGLALPLALFVVRALGGGDVKLLAAVGTWLGPGGVLRVFAVAAILGLVIVLAQALIRRRLGTVLGNVWALVVGMAATGALVPDPPATLTQQSGSAPAPGEVPARRRIDRPLPYAVVVFLATTLIVLAGQLQWR